MSSPCGDTVQFTLQVYILAERDKCAKRRIYYILPHEPALHALSLVTGPPNTLAFSYRQVVCFHVIRCYFIACKASISGTSMYGPRKPPYRPKAAFMHAGSLALMFTKRFQIDGRSAVNRETIACKTWK